MALSPLAQQLHNAGGMLTLQLNLLGIKSIKSDRTLPKFLGCGGLVNINSEGEVTPTSAFQVQLEHTLTEPLCYPRGSEWEG